MGGVESGEIRVRSAKTSMSPDEIREKLIAMTKLAADRMSAGSYWFKVAGKKRYVRINSSKFRAVSLDAENPCGHLHRSNIEVRGKILKSALFEAADPECKNHVPGNAKPEHRVQAFTIWQALNDPQGLPKVLGIADHVDALWFVTDELSLPPIRADVILLGERAGRYFPVFVELKDGRTTEVAAQLNDAVKIASAVSAEFRQFLSAATGKPVDAIEMERAIPMAIWGSSDRPRPEALKMTANLMTICHSELGKKGEPGYGSFRFSLA